MLHSNPFIVTYLDLSPTFRFETTFALSSLANLSFLSDRKTERNESDKSEKIHQ